MAGCSRATRPRPGPPLGPSRPDGRCAPPRARACGSRTQPGGGGGASRGERRHGPGRRAWTAQQEETSQWGLRRGCAAFVVSRAVVWCRGTIRRVRAHVASGRPAERPYAEPEVVHARVCRVTRARGFVCCLLACGVWLVLSCSGFFMSLSQHSRVVAARHGDVRCDIAVPDPLQRVPVQGLQVSPGLVPRAVVRPITGSDPHTTRQSRCPVRSRPGLGRRRRSPETARTSRHTAAVYCSW